MNKIFLDLDNTLISSEATSSFYRMEESQDYYDYASVGIEFGPHDFYAVFVNPFAEDLIEFCAEFGEVNICTAASPEYAGKIVNELISQDFWFKPIKNIYSTRDTPWRGAERAEKEKRVLVDNLSPAHMFSWVKASELKLKTAEEYILFPEFYHTLPAPPIDKVKKQIEEYFNNKIVRGKFK